MNQVGSYFTIIFLLITGCVSENYNAIFANILCKLAFKSQSQMFKERAQNVTQKYKELYNNGYDTQPFGSAYRIVLPFTYGSCQTMDWVFIKKYFMRNLIVLNGAEKFDRYKIYEYTLFDRLFNGDWYSIITGLDFYQEYIQSLKDVMTEICYMIWDNYINDKDPSDVTEALELYTILERYVDMLNWILMGHDIFISRFCQTAKEIKSESIYLDKLCDVNWKGDKRLD
ncbi:hypothetical protein RF11_10426 [Thelohanellus kitauei]|uniref:Uncharacterized protein n=1 Tax=Thelohanellus kitauei TaxID=669202 RepID=A0A0C2JZQ2_THEKT|nr:hypothetical protein RF11_10426 [Thelohanellus kitauei]